MNGAGAKASGATTKGKPSHAAVVFRLAGFQDDACISDITVGPFELTIEDGTVSVDPDELPIPPEALALFRDGQLALCAKTQADFDGSIALGEVAFQTGRLHGDEERVTLCHMPPSEEDEPHTITVGSSAVDTHLAHGDQLGECDENRDGEDHAQDGDQGGVDGEQNSADNGGSEVRDDGDFDTGENSTSDDGQDSTTGDGEGNRDENDDDEQSDTVAPTDSDNDGVTDNLDQCPNTAPGATVDANGCNCGQLDADSDGVNNCNDTCTGTSAGLSVDATGCASNQLDDDNG